MKTANTKLPRMRIAGPCLIAVIAGLAQFASASTYHTLVNTYDWSHWNNAYPWGNTHNGSAYMQSDHVTMGSTLTLHAQRSSAHSGYNFVSGTIYCQDQILCDANHINWTIDGEFKCSTAAGCWPAMWCDGAWTWPPETDIMEFKGSATVWQNTFITSSQVYSHTKTVSYPLDNWHHFKIWMSRVDDTNVTIDYYIDGTWQARDTANFSGKPMWLIIDFQTEGSSGTATWNDKYVYSDSIEVGYSSP